MADASVINPFLNATLDVFTTMCFMTPKPGKPFVKNGNDPQGDITGIIGMASEKMKGTMALIFPKDVAIAVVSKMLMGQQFTDITDEVVDGIGELTNMISGGAKRELNEQGMLFVMALPSMVKGYNHSVHHQADTEAVICIPFDVEAGRFYVEACMQQEEE